jgi:hypothetical protein
LLVLQAANCAAGLFEASPTSSAIIKKTLARRRQNRQKINDRFTVQLCA